MRRPLILTGLQIDETLDRMLSGRIHVGQVPEPLARWYWAGLYEPDPTHAAQIELLQTDLNYWYWRATAPEEHSARMRAILTGFDVRAERTATEARWRALDIAEQQRQAALDESKAGA